MGAPTSEVGYTSATTGRGDHGGGIGLKNIFIIRVYKFPGSDAVTFNR
jgi:hypothetical protein